MNQSVVPQESSIDDSSTLPNPQPSSHHYPRPLNRLKGRGRDYQCVLTFAPVRKLPARVVPAPELPAPPPAAPLPPAEAEELELEMPRQTLWSRVAAFLNGGASVRKQLRLAETVALGEKRFVAIIHAEGHKYLVGGGTSGVALLTKLDDSAKAIEHLPRFSEAIEAAG